MDIQVKFDGKEIIVTKPGTDFIVAYRKSADSATLKLTRSWAGPHMTSPAISEFRSLLRQRSARRASSDGLCERATIFREREKTGVIGGSWPNGQAPFFFIERRFPAPWTIETLPGAFKVIAIQ
jgi:hypothetical protein